jgi:hypothetical protein
MVAASLSSRPRFKSIRAIAPISENYAITSKMENQNSVAVLYILVARLCVALFRNGSIDAQCRSLKGMHA